MVIKALFDISTVLCIVHLVLAKLVQAAECLSQAAVLGS